MKWDELQSKHSGKIHASVGELDNFLLKYSVHLFDEEMKNLNTGFEFAYYPGDHFTVSSADYISSGYHFLEQRYYNYRRNAIK